MRLLILILLVILPFSSLAKWNVAFIGLSGNGAPSLEKGYENLLREKLLVESDLLAKDYLECQKFRRVIGFDDYAAVPINYLENLVRFADDSLLVVWGTVKNFQLNYQQKKLFSTEIKGELQIGLHIYSLFKKKFLYIGDVSAVIFKPKGIGFFKSKQPISAKDRSELITLLQSEAVANSCSTISAVIKAEKPTNAIYSNEVTDKAPSISDVFSIPSAEPAPIESTTAKKKVIDTLKTGKETKR
jgi:hypothetical protein